MTVYYSTVAKQYIHWTCYHFNHPFSLPLQEETAFWDEGANLRGKSKKVAADSKADEQVKKKQEMAELLAADEADISGTVFKVKKVKKAKGKDDFDKLNEALAAVPKTKAQKLAEEKKRTAELKRKKEDEERIKRNEEKRKREADAIKAGVVLDDGDQLMLVGNTNKLDTDVVEATGITNALSALSTSSTGATEDAHPEKRQKTLHKAYVEKMMPIMKQDHPGLRMTQYQEKIFEMWKTSPENPRYVSTLKAKEEQKKATINGVIA
jgi:hypothetical protein